MNHMNQGVHKNVIQKGFTLVELLVAVAIFMVVTVSTLGAFLSMIDLSKKVQNVRVAMDNANLAMETMMRNIRLGYDYESGENGGIRLKDQNGRSLEYGLVCVDVLKECARYGLGVKKDNTQEFTTLTSSDVNIEIATFDITGAPSLTDNEQPSVKIFIKGKTTLPIKDQLNFDFVFQSLATQRLYDK
jgi:prepilin-type N-terminal cleavage/methylation domain-containing protein